MRPFRSSEVLGVAAGTRRFALAFSRETPPADDVRFRRGEDARPRDLDRVGGPTEPPALGGGLSDRFDYSDCFDRLDRLDVTVGALP